MRSALPLRRTALPFALLALVASLATVGCARNAAPAVGPGGHGEGQMGARDVRDDEFAPSLYKLLRDGAPSPERTALLVGVVRRQLAHAAARFASAHDARATESVVGALYLIRAGEGRKEMVDAAGAKALGGALDKVSTKGDEGRALALMRLRAPALDKGSPARTAQDEHLAALEQWMKETHGGGSLQRLGADERAKVARALLEPTSEAREEAAAAVSAWITEAIRYNDEVRQSGQRPEREEFIESTRALESGGHTMVALFLRDGDAAGAVRHIDASPAKRIVEPALYARLRGAAEPDGAHARDWQTLAIAFARQNMEQSEPETSIDPDLLSAGLWGSAVEAFRSDPTGLDVSMLLARLLVHFGMAEAAPLVLADALAVPPGQLPPGAAASAMELLGAALDESASIDDFDGARRTFHAGARILALADGDRRVEPSGARLRFAMGAVEIRNGNLGEARALLKAALAVEPSVAAFTTLALLERQAGDTKAALAAVEQALHAPDARKASLDVADAHLLAFELHRDGASPGLAKGPLDSALTSALAARQAASAADKTHAERLLGRILEAYGDTEGAARAFERAFQLSAGDRIAMGATMLDAIGRALVRHDLKAARVALRRGIEGDASEDDLVYGGLWVSLLEREQHAPADGAVDRALRGGNRTPWTAKLSGWANGKVSDAELAAAAQSASQRVEAAFYSAMGRKLAGDPAAEQRLRAVTASPVIDLLEVQLARELLAPRAHNDLPGGVKLP